MLGSDDFRAPRLAWLGLAWLGLAWLGLAWLANFGFFSAPQLEIELIYS
jgi:hypothetical protein